MTPGNWSGIYSAGVAAWDAIYAEAAQAVARFGGAVRYKRNRLDDKPKQKPAEEIAPVVVARAPKPAPVSLPDPLEQFARERQQEQRDQAAHKRAVRKAEELMLFMDDAQELRSLRLAKKIRALVNPQRRRREEEEVLLM